MELITNSSNLINISKIIMHSNQNAYVNSHYPVNDLKKSINVEKSVSSDEESDTSKNISISRNK